MAFGLFFFLYWKQLKPLYFGRTKNAFVNKMENEYNSKRRIEFRYRMLPGVGS